MKKFKVNVPCEYVQGYLRYGHGEAVIEAETIEEARAKAKEYAESRDLDIILDDYSLEDYLYMLDDIEVSEVE